MAKSISRTGKRGRGRPRINPTSIHLSLAPDLLARVDQFLAAQKDSPSRPEAVRRLVELGLAAMQPMRRRSPKATSKALDLASKQIDKLSDPSATDEERQQRKRRLIKGPKEFREIRDDILSKSKG
jgi:hypothetical protein